MRFVDVKNDVAFHKIFGNANKTVTLISFLNAVMDMAGEDRIVDVTIENPYLFPSARGGKTVVIDVRATDVQGRHFIVELQVADKEGFDKRTQYYAAREYSSQIERGEEYPMLRPTYFIGILDFNFTENPKYFSNHQTIDTATGQWLLKDIRYFFIELPKFKKSLDELETMMDKWTYFVKNSENLTIMPGDVTDNGLATAYLEADRHNWTKTEMDAYIDAGAQLADQYNELTRAEERGLELGVEKTIAATVVKLRDKGKSFEEIADLLDLQHASVLAIIEKYNNPPNN